MPVICDWELSASNRSLNKTRLTWKNSHPIRKVIWICFKGIPDNSTAILAAP
jgi:hypothetical protein